MAFPVYTIQVFAQTVTVTLAEFLVPAGQTLVVRDIEAHAIAGAPAVINVGISGLGVFFELDLTAATVRWDGRFAVKAGQSFAIWTSAGSARVAVTAYLLGSP